jgi:hypothetical protein
MIHNKCFTAEWIAAKSRELHYPDRNIIEKVIRAFSLLDMLAAAGCPLHFKGGSCLMLLLTDQPYRLSIDIDIICPPGTNIEMYLTRFKEYGFINYESIERVQRGTDIPKSHSKFFYKVAFLDDSNRNEHILLDVLNEECHYINTVELPIQNIFLEIVGEPNRVRVPSVGDILGDKLTAFAPNTTGIPYYKGNRDCSLEIIKQLYDVGRLFDKVENLDVTTKAFQKIASVELSYRGLDDNLNIIFDDIRNTALCIATRGKIGVGDFEMLMRGVSRIKSFMFQSMYSLEDAMTDAAKAAYVATCMEKKETEVNKYPGNPISIANLELPDTVTSRLNKLKRISPEAFYYWVQVGNLLAR